MFEVPPTTTINTQEYVPDENSIAFAPELTGEIAGRVLIVGKHEAVFADLPLDNPGHEAYESKDHQRQVLSGYYAYTGQEIRDDDLFLVFDFELAAED